MRPSLPHESVAQLGYLPRLEADHLDPRIAIGALLLLFCLVGSGAAMLLGAVFRNEGPALGTSLGLGLGLAAVGGAMMPLEIMGEPVRTIAKFTPHSWGYEGFAELVRHGGGIVDIAPQLGVLAAFAAVLFALGAWQLRRAIVS
jgi:ABC-2 type transport system permease protein